MKNLPNHFCNASLKNVEKGQKKIQGNAREKRKGKITDREKIEKEEELEAVGAYRRRSVK